MVTVPRVLKICYADASQYRGNLVPNCCSALLCKNSSKYCKITGIASNSHDRQDVWNQIWYIRVPAVLALPFHTLSLLSFSRRETLKVYLAGSMSYFSINCCNIQLTAATMRGTGMLVKKPTKSWLKQTSSQSSATFWKNFVMLFIIAGKVSKPKLSGRVSREIRSKTVAVARKSFANKKNL